MYTELLAPAKNKEVAFAAIECGADAIYIGAPNYGARMNARNSIEDIASVVNYAHKFWVKVYVTLNTILLDSELEEAIDLIYELQEIGVDALIVQDMGILKRIIDIQNSRSSDVNKITIPIHMSTQCDNRDNEKIKFYSDMGISRAVLARELSLEKIKEIHKNVPEIELEAFIHGALCVSYSGQCYLSQYIGGRSANKGECAQPCRKKYDVVTDKGEVLAKNIHALCLKDFNASCYLKEMIESGVYSFKIEGRLKDITYVKNITGYYRHELDKYSNKTSSGKSIFKFIPNPYKSFNRGFTDYFLEDRKDCFNFESPKSRGEYLGKIIEVRNGTFKLRSDKKISNQDGLTNGKIGFLVNKIQNGYIYPNNKCDLHVGEKIYRNYDVAFEKELEQPVKRQISLNITVKDNKLLIIDEDGVDIQVDIPKGEIPLNQEKANSTFEKQFKKTGDSDFYIKEFKIENDLPFLPVSLINELRRVAFEQQMKKRIEKYKLEFLKSLKYVPYYKSELDYRGNIYNKSAKEFYEHCGVVVKEMALEKKVPNHTVELMRTKHCIKYALGICKSPRNLILKDEYGVKYPLKFDCKNCEMIVLNPN